jgi:hypothetical protein
MTVLAPACHHLPPEAEWHWPGPLHAASTEMGELGSARCTASQSHQICQDWVGPVQFARPAHNEVPIMPLQAAAWWSTSTQNAPASAPTSETDGATQPCCRSSKDRAMCASCIAKIGATSSCKDCASLAAPAARRQCIACLTSQDQACAGCLPTLTGSLAASAACFACFAATKDPAAKPFCASCGNSNDPKTCLKCVTGQVPYAAVPAHSRKGCYWFVSGQINSGSPQFKQGIRCLQLAKNGRQADGCISCAIQLAGQGVLDCLQTMSRLKTDLGKLNAYLCVGFNGGVNGKCVACMAKAASAKAVAKCSLA